VGLGFVGPFGEFACGEERPRAMSRGRTEVVIKVASRSGKGGSGVKTGAICSGNCFETFDFEGTFLLESVGHFESVAE
jgi:hypothetical protein